MGVGGFIQENEMKALNGEGLSYLMYVKVLELAIRRPDVFQSVFQTQTNEQISPKK